MLDLRSSRPTSQRLVQLAIASVVVAACGAAAARPAAAQCGDRTDARTTARALRAATRCAYRQATARDATSCSVPSPPACANALVSDVAALARGATHADSGASEPTAGTTQRRCQRAITGGIAGYVAKKLGGLVAGVDSAKNESRAAARLQRIGSRCAVTVGTIDTDGTLPTVGAQCSAAIGPVGASVDAERLRRCLRSLLEIWTERVGPNPPVLRPNIVLIITDDQRWDTLDTMPTVASEVVAKGILFANSFCNLSSCAPSRATLLTGNYAHTTGVLANEPPLGGVERLADGSTVATWLQAQGYRTGYFGKYINGYDRITPVIPPGWDTWRAFSSTPLEELNLGNYYRYTVNDDGVEVSYGDAPADYSTDVLRDDAVDFIDAHAAAPQPFFVVFSPYAVHQPLIAADRHIGAMADLGPWRPLSFQEEDVSDKPPMIQVFAGLLRGTDSDLTRIRQLEMLLAVDDAVAALLAALEDADELARTVVLYTSDNGFMWSEHALLQKGFAYEESMRVPLAIRFDAVVAPGRTSDALVSNVDLAPTLAALAGGAPPSATDGLSLAPILSANADEVRDDLLGEFWGGGAAPDYWMVRTPQWKYVSYAATDTYAPFEELYDLAADPFEMDNLTVTAATDPSVLVRLDDMRERLARLLAAEPGP